MNPFAPHHRGRGRTPAVVFVLAAVVLPALLGAICLDRGHHGDTATFYKWYRAARQSPGAVYVDPHADVNYPVLGVAASTVGGALFELVTGRVPTAEEFHRWHHACLVPWSVLFVLLVERLLRGAGVERAGRWALFIWALPCCWVPGLYFAQIDGVAMVFLLAAALCIQRFERGGSRSGGWLAGASGMATSAVLTKQLAVFALPGLALGVLFAARGRRARLAPWAALPALGLVAFEPWLAHPAGYHSHLAYVWLGAGPRHQDILGNGPSVWALLRRPALASSHEALAFGITPFGVGIALFAALLVAGGFAFARDLRAGVAPSVASWRASGLSCLAMALALPGSHDRYAFYALPTLLLAARVCRGWRVTAALGTYWGIYLLTTVEYDALAPVAPWVMPHLVAVALAVLFVVHSASSASIPARISRAWESPT